MSLIEDMESLETAEDFLAYFNVAADPRVVQVNRLHILQRFHEGLEASGGLGHLSDATGFVLAQATLKSACAEFAQRTACEAKVFKVHRLDDERQAARFVALDAIRGLES